MMMDGGCAAEVLVVDGICDGFLDDVKLDIELVSAGGINEGEGVIGGCDAVVLVELDVQELLAVSVPVKLYLKITSLSRWCRQRRC
jgi:hypothetical protein